MRLVKSGDTVTVNFNGESVKFTDGHVSREPSMKVIVKGKELSKDFMVFMETNEMLEKLPLEEQNELWDIYTTAYELTLEPVAVRTKHLKGLFKRLEKVLPLSKYVEMYPHGSLWTPATLALSVEEIEVNHTRDMTYVRSEYHDLLVLTLILRPMIPLFMVMGIYQKGQTVQEKRNAVDNRYRLMDVLENMSLINHPAVDKLRLYIPEIVRRHKEEESFSSFNKSNIDLTASIVAHGSDALETYFLAFALFNSLPYHSIAQKYQDEFLGTSAVVRVYRGVKAEIERGYVDRVSLHEVTEKLHAMQHKIGGDESKLSVIDIVGARSAAPIEERVIEEEYIEDYRSYIKNLAVEIPPAQFKVMIDHMVSNPPSFLTQLHEVLTVTALQLAMGDIRNAKDIHRDYFVQAMGIAQEFYCSRGFRSIATLLSCTVTPAPRRADYPFEPVKHEMKQKLARYYPQTYHTNKRGKFECPAMTSIQLLIKNHINQMEFSLDVKDEYVASRLGVSVGKQIIAPAESFVEDLAEVLYLQAKAFWRFPDVRNVETPVEDTL